MTSFLSFVLTLFVIFVSTSAARADDLKKEERFILAITSPVPQYAKAYSIFWDLTNHWQNEVIRNDPKLAAMADLGRNFRHSYFRLLELQYGKEGLSFFENPENQILLWLKKFRQHLTENASRPIRESKARALALEDTTLQFGLPEDTTVAELENLSTKNSKYAQAFAYFKRKYFQLLLLDERRPDINSSNIEKFKEHVESLLLEWRKINFLTLLRRYKQQIGSKHKPTTLLYKNTSGIFSIRRNQNIDLDLNILIPNPLFVGNKDLRSTHVFSTEESTVLRRIVKYYAVGKVKNLQQDREMFIPAVDFIYQERYSVIFGGASTPRFTLDENSFQNLLHSLMPEWENLDHKDLQTNVEARYYMEAFNRDSLLANTIHHLFLVTQESEAQFESRIKARRTMNYNAHF